MKSIKKLISKSSIYFFIVNLILLVFSVFIIIYIYFYSNNFSKINQIAKNIEKLNNDFEYFNAEINLYISKPKTIGTIENSNFYERTIKNIDLVINSTIEYENINNLILTYKNNIFDYVKTINAFVNDSSDIWKEIREYNIDKINKSLIYIDQEFKQIEEIYRSKYYKLIVIILILLFVIFINIFIYIFLQLKYSLKIIKYINKLNKVSCDLHEDYIQDGAINFIEFNNKINIYDYEELDNFSSIYFKLINDFNTNNLDLNNKLSKNNAQTNLYKSFNKFAIAVIDSINYPILVSNLSDEIIFINKSFCKVFNHSIDDIKKINFKNYFNKQCYFIDSFNFEYQNNKIGLIYIFRDKSSYDFDINNLNENLSYSNFVDFISKTRNVDTLTNSFNAFEKKNSLSKNKVINISNYLLDNLINTSYIYNNLEYYELNTNPFLLKLIFNLVFYKIEDDFKIVVNKENNMLIYICDSKKSKIDSSNFIKFVVAKLQKDFNLKVDYYSNSKGSKLRFMFLED